MTVRAMRSSWFDRPVIGLTVALAAFASLAAADGWKAVPLFGADVRSLAFDPVTSTRVLAGTSSGQVYESLDSGSTWEPAGERVALPGWVVSELRFDPHHPDRVWAALWALWGADGAVAVSEDSGRSWRLRRGNLPSGQVYTLALAPDRSGELYAATRNGVWGTGDAGVSWRHLTSARPTMGKVTSLLVDPYDSDVLYAGSWRRAYRSDDRGVTWNGIFEGMVLDSEVFTLRPGPAGEGDLWASTCGWVYHGRERGALWQRHTNGLAERRTPSFEVLAGGRLLAGTVAGVYGSDDRGASWQLASDRLAVGVIAAHPDRPGLVLIGGEGSGVWRSLDGGRSFAPSAAGMVSLRVTDIVQASDELALSVRHTEQRDGVHRLAGTHLSFDEQGDLPTVLDLAAADGVLYAATERGLWRHREGTWTAVPEFGASRLETLAASSDWIVGRTRSEIVSLRGGSVERVAWSLDGRSLALWSDAVWMTGGGHLWRWDGGQPTAVPIPGKVKSVGVFGQALVAETSIGRLSIDQSGHWSEARLAGDRLLPTGDRSLPYLALWRRGRASLHDAFGRERAQYVLPVPERDVSASVLVDGRLHLATAGYGLLWSNVLQLEASGGTAMATVAPAAAGR